MNKRQHCTCKGSCQGPSALGSGWICVLQTCPNCGEENHQCVCEPIAHPDNPTFASNKPHCNECDGAHEPTGSRSNCIRHWKHLAFEAIQSVEWARTLLCSATPSKVLDETKSREWCAAFGKWFAESHSLPVLIDENGCAGQVCKWLESGKYRTVMHRHTETFRAVDELKDQMLEAGTIPLLADAIIDWDGNAKSLQI